MDFANLSLRAYRGKELEEMKQKIRVKYTKENKNN
jgi:hypothetical protein